MTNREWWTVIDDFEGAWCPCTGSSKKLPNVILNIWHRQSGKSMNLARIAIDYKLKYPSKKVLIVCSPFSEILRKTVEILIEESGEEITDIHIGTFYDIKQIFKSTDFDLLLLDEFLHCKEKHLSELISIWNGGHKKGTVIGWSSPSSSFVNHTEILRNLKMIGGTRVMTNMFSASENPDVDIPRYLTKESIDREYNLLFD